MKIKGIIIFGVLAIAAILGFRAYQHSQWSPEEKAQQISSKMAEKLALNEDQIAAVQEINLKRILGHYEAYEAGRNRDLIKEAVAEWEASLREVLNEEQIEKLHL